MIVKGYNIFDVIRGKQLLSLTFFSLHTLFRTVKHKKQISAILVECALVKEELSSDPINLDLG